MPEEDRPVIADQVDTEGVEQAVAGVDFEASLEEQVLHLLEGDLADAADAEADLPDPPIPGVPGLPSVSDDQGSLAASDDPLIARNFGVFRVTPRLPGSGSGGGSYGGFQAACPFHKLSASSGCRRWFQISGPYQADKEMAVRKLMWWCSKHGEFNRQRDHLRCDLDSAQCPGYQELRALKVWQRPPRGSVMCDAELDQGHQAESEAALAADAVVLDKAADSNDSSSSSSSKSSSSTSSSS